MTTTLLGLFAATLTTISFIPQVIQGIKTKNLSGVSLKMYVILTTGILLWIVYGIIISDLPIIVANGVTFCLASIILALKINYK